MKIISGGQTGADQGGLRAARRLGIETGGMAPKLWRVESGTAPWLSEYGLIESESESYKPRTIDNILCSDGTVIFGKNSSGSNLTALLCKRFDKPCMWVRVPSSSFQMPLFLAWLKLRQIMVLNVAGNRESVNPGIGKDVEGFLVEALGGNVDFDILMNPDKYGYTECSHCNGYGSSLKEPDAKCTKCGGSGLVKKDSQ